LKFDIQARDTNEILKGTGMDRRVGAVKLIQTDDGQATTLERNNTYNKYMEYKIKCMRKALADGKPNIF
jgi:hypothetical protein